MKEPIIVGIDPGTTLGYAVLDIGGSVKEVGSLKVHSLHGLITAVISHGHVVAVGCDKKQVPSFVETFRVKTGAKMVSPPRDLLVEEKRGLVGSYPCQDSHQTDALASALFCHQSLRPLIRKVRLFIEREGKEAHASQLYDLVIRQGSSIRHAIDMIERPADPETSALARSIAEDRFTKERFLALYERMREREDEILRMKADLARARSDKKAAKAECKALSRAIRQPEGKHQHSLQKAISKERSLRVNAEAVAGTWRRALLEKDDIVVFMKIRDLGRGFPGKGVFLSDRLFVQEPKSWSREVVAALEKRVSFLAALEPFPRPLQGRAFATLVLDKGDITEAGDLVIVRKKTFDLAVRDASSLRKIIDDYQRERQER